MSILLTMASPSNKSQIEDDGWITNCVDVDRLLMIQQDLLPLLTINTTLVPFLLHAVVGTVEIWLILKTISMYYFTIQ